MKRSLSTVAVLAAIALTVSGCAGDGGNNGSGGGDDAEVSSVKVGTLPIINSAPYYLAEREGYFTEEGLSVSAKAYAGFQPQVAALMNGEVDIAMTTVVPLMVAASKELPIRVFGGIDRVSEADDTSVSANVLIGRKGTSLSLKDLNNTTIGVSNVGGLQDLAVQAAIDDAGGDSSTVEFIDVPFANAEQALDEGTVAAVAFVEPFGSQALDHGYPLISNFMRDAMPGAIVMSVYTSDEFASKNPEVIEKFLNAFDRGTKLAADSPDEVRKIVPEFTQLSKEVVKNVTLPLFRPGIKSADIEQLNKILVKYDFLANPVDPTTFLLKVGS